MPQDWDQLARTLLRYAARLGASPEQAEDLAQSTLLAYVRAPHRHDPAKGSLNAWLCTSLRNRFIDQYRRARTRRDHAPALRLVQPDADAPDLVLARERSEQRRQAFLAALEDDERRVFFAWIRQRRGEWDVQGAAAALDLTPAAYEAAKKRLRRRCARLLDELGVSVDDLISPEEGSAA